MTFNMERTIKQVARNVFASKPNVQAVIVLGVLKGGSYHVLYSGKRGGAHFWSTSVKLKEARRQLRYLASDMVPRLKVRGRYAYGRRA